VGGTSLVVVSASGRLAIGHPQTVGSRQRQIKFRPPAWLFAIERQGLMIWRFRQFWGNLRAGNCVFEKAGNNRSRVERFPSLVERISPLLLVSEQRRGELRRIVQTQGFASLSDLADSLSVSESTVRRDVEFLEQLGEARRTHGGVFWTGSPAEMRVFDTRGDSSATQKRAIAVVAASLVSDGETILLDGGSTTYEIARQLVSRPLQVVTNSLPVANLLSSCEQIDLVLVGGCVHHRTGVTIGPIADSQLSTLRVDKAFLSVAGIDENGFYNSNLLLVETEKTMRRIAKDTIIVADSSKFGRASLSRLCGLDDVRTVVTDKDLPQAWQNQMRDAGVELILAGNA